MINLELAKKHEETFGQVMMLAEHMMRPYSRKYDKEEHTYPVEMEEVAKLIGGARSEVTGGKKQPVPEGTVVNGGNMGAVVGLFGLCWGDVGLFLGMPGSGLGNAAISAVGTPEQVKKYGGSYAAMCITEPGTGSDSANISTTAVADGDESTIGRERKRLRPISCGKSSDAGERAVRVGGAPHQALHHAGDPHGGDVEDDADGGHPEVQLDGPDAVHLLLAEQARDQVIERAHGHQAHPAQGTRVHMAHRPVGVV